MLAQQAASHDRDERTVSRRCGKLASEMPELRPKHFRCERFHFRQRHLLERLDARHLAHVDVVS
ncbi:MAG TPA: hypothetical protein VJZ00_11245 [Thermoanaerobaculia bacterium]|nr:hypothetical protein [Thermoanaerobaculia bacterium]